MAATIARGHPLDGLLATFEAMSMAEVVALADASPATAYGLTDTRTSNAQYMPERYTAEVDNEMEQTRRRMATRDRLRLKLERRRAV